MKPHPMLFTLVAATIVGLSIFIYIGTQQERVPLLPRDPQFRNAELPIETRVDDLISYMTLAEKVGQMALVEKNSIEEIEDISVYGLGSLLSGAGAKPDNNTPEGWKEMIGEFVSASRASRLGIPIMYGVDAVHGHANIPGATVFPHSIGLGASADTQLVERVARVTADELRATGVTWSYSPNLDMPRDIRWGRTYETFSDDPKLTSALGVAFLRGTQDQYVKGEDTYISMLGTLKHFLGAGGMAWGSSTNKNFTLDQGLTEADETMLRTQYMLPFKAAIDARALSVMAGLNTWGATKIAASEYLLTDVLKGEIGFRGFVVSDWYGVYEIPGNDYEAAVTAINAGVDIVMLPFDYKPFVRNVMRAVRRGDIEESRIDDAVRRILRAKFSLGLLDGTFTVAPTLETIGSPEHRAVAREAVAKSLVLLKNRDGALPLGSDVNHIRVAGSSADNVGRQAGGWTVEWQGIDGNWLPGATSILHGIRTRAGEGVRIEYEALGNFEGEEIADIGIAIVGEAPYSEGWGDSEYPTLDPADIAAIERLKAASRQVIVIIVSGRPLFITDKVSSWDALVAAWLPGSEGAGVADVLFGDKPFVGRLPVPWPAFIGQIPIASNGITADGTQPLFSRYFGLSQ